MRWLVALAMLGVSSLVPGAQAFSGTVVTVIDGDTVVVARGAQRSTVRLAAIDAPEKMQTYGEASRDALAALVLRKTVEVRPVATDEFGRLVALLREGGVNVNAEQIRSGMAWENSLYHADQAMVALQTEARRARRGLWAGANPQPPWQFRKQHEPTREVQALPGACGKKHSCSQMTSCEEAKFYWTQCRVKTLDKDGDGVPCENLCAAKK